MDALTVILLILVVVALISGVFLGYFLTNKRYQDNIASLEDIQAEHNNYENKLKNAQNELWSVTQRLDNAKQEAETSLASYQKAQE